jgi:hypothetical protein
MGDDVADVMGVAQTHVRERRAAVGRLVDAVAPADAVADAGLARADPDDVRVALEERDVTDRRRPVLVEDRIPGRPGIRRLEDAAGGGCDQYGREVRLERVDVRDAAGHIGRADVAPDQVGVEVRRLRRLARRRAAGRNDQGDEQDHGRKAAKARGRHRGNSVGTSARGLVSMRRIAQAIGPAGPRVWDRAPDMEHLAP